MNTTEFFDVTVDTIVREADGVLSLALSHPPGRALPSWEPGAHIDLLLPTGTLRQYSLCSTPGSPRWRVAVLRERAGRGGSAFIHDELQPGTKVQVREPRNNFALAPAPEYLFIAGGIGITPILPMLRQATEAGRPWRLLYLGRSRKSMAFLEELSVHGNRVHLHASDESGRFCLADLLSQSDGTFHLYACGPGPLLAAIGLLTAAWEDPSRSHFERFAADPAETAGAAADREGDSPFILELADGTEVTVASDCSALEALENAGVPVVSSCREGICGTCETPVLAGDIDHRDSLLSDSEKASMDTMMICVSRGRSRLTLGI
ncbi:PDR/VanB family oxidoreductase [Pseudarthrobacter sp. H2]|uniref:PDR/VanB family oxidoreductase n=1 Tax=Pseudarthrobacter sp. H2 TaxID=3418415 RepID=UPI003CE8CE82